MSLILKIITICLVGIISCSCSAQLKTTTGQAVTDKTLAALSAVKYYRLDTAFSMDPQIEWKGTKTVNVPDKAMAMNMAISMGPLNVADEMYFKTGFTYLKTIAPADIPPTFGWTKTPTASAEWDNQTQIPKLEELLKTAAGFSPLQHELLNGIDCYVFSFVASAQASVDYVLSQYQPGGPTFYSMESGIMVAPETYKAGSVKFWISTENYLPLKVEANLAFNENRWNGVSSTEVAEVSYQSQLNFSNYNQPVSIKVPREALDVN